MSTVFIVFEKVPYYSNTGTLMYTDKFSAFANKELAIEYAEKVCMPVFSKNYGMLRYTGEKDITVAEVEVQE